MNSFHAASMSSSFTLTSTFFSIYGGIPIFVFGTVGNLVNLLLLFPSRSISCSFILLVSSIFNLVALNTGLLPRILLTGFGIDGSSTNMVWCRCRLFVLYIGMMMSLTCICLASIDRFLVTSRHATWRNRSTLKTMKIILIFAFIAIAALNIPYAIYFTIVEGRTPTGTITNRCSLINANLSFYGNYVVRPLLLSLLPGTILMITGSLTCYNVKSIKRIRTRDTFQRRLTSMLILQSFVTIIPMLPFAIINIYQTATASISKSSYRLAQETLIFDMSSILLYISYASNFYVYFLSSIGYRRDFFNLIRCRSFRRSWANRIGPTTRQQFEMNTALMMRNLPLSVCPTNP